MNRTQFWVTFSVALSLLFNIQTQAQTFTIGANNGTNTNVNFPTPFGDYYRTSHSQFLYRASELTAAGMTAGFITQIGWNVVSVIPTVGASENYTLSIGTTAATSLGFSTWEPGTVPVWGPLNYTPVTGVNNFTLNAPFYWDGTSNIVVEVCGGSMYGSYTNNAKVTWTGPLGFNGSRTYANDDEPDPCGYAGPDYIDFASGGTDYRPQIQFTVTDAADCSEIPAGATYASDLSVCSDELFSVSIDPIAAYGITYQWYSSPDGVIWNPIAGATAAAFSLFQESPSWYYCAVSCTVSGATGSSDPLFIDNNSPGTCYCEPTISVGTGDGDFISHVVLNDIDHATGAFPYPYYVYYPDQNTDLLIDSTYTIYVTCGSYPTNNSVAAWIDFNGDGVFDNATEKLGEATGLASYTTSAFTFTVPNDAITDTVRLRVRDAYGATGMIACAEYDYSEIEDYNVQLLHAVAPVANYISSGDPDVVFTDMSDNYPVTWEWTFGDGGTSTLQNPSHTYALNGTYNVCLTATNGIGSDTYCTDIIIDSYLPPTANFNYVGDPVVNFTDLSTQSPDTWFWDFGDGGTSALQNPSHTYAMNGTYTVCLTAANPTGNNTYCQDVVISSYLAPLAAFDYTGDPIITFTDNSDNDPTAWEWDFGDGGTSTLQNPVHTFTENGTYNICLTATNAVGSNTYCTSIIIDGYIAPIALFTGSGDPVTVFTDMSINTVTSWLWDFGDGTFSTLENPTHTFAENNDYVVCLTVSGPGGSDGDCAIISIDSAALSPDADFSYIFVTGMTVGFTDLSANLPNDWQWDFGDGSISGLQNPVHTFASYGNYNVCLTAINAAGESNLCREVDVVLGINNSQESPVLIQPNPATDYISLSSSPDMMNCQITILNHLGQPVISTSGNIQSGALSIDVSQFPSGTYLLRILSENKTYVQPFIKL